MVKVAKKKRTASTASHSKADSTCHGGCNKELDENTKAIKCERCGEQEGTWKCIECLSMSENFFDELTNLSGNNVLHWYCNKCEKAKQNEKHDIRIESVLQLLTQAMDRISSLENVIVSYSDVQNKIIDRIESADNKIQLLVDVTIPPPIMNDTMSVTVHENTNTEATNSSDTTSDDIFSQSQPATVVRNTCWSDLFNRVSEVAADVQAVKQATITNSTKPEQPKPKDDNTNRSVVIYGMPESKNDTNDTLSIDRLIKQLDNSISIDTHRRLRKKQPNQNTESNTLNNKPVPILVTLSSNFDRRKLLSLAPNLKSYNHYKGIYIKRALSESELQETMELRQKCSTANEILRNTDPNLESKFSVVDGKIRRMVKITDSENYKVDWSKVISASDLPKN